MADAATIREWLLNLPIPWLVGGPWGRAEQGAQGTIYDGQVGLLKEAMQAAVPSAAPSDALDAIGADRQLIQGSAESDANFRIRLRDAWAQHKLRGTWLGLLIQLYWSLGVQPGGAYIIQQNGRVFSLITPPTAGESETIAATHLYIDQVPNDNVTFYPTSVPFYLLGPDRDHTSQFGIIFPSPWLGPFRNLGVAQFDGTSDRATVTWLDPIAGSYTVLLGAPVIDSGGPVVVSADGLTQTSASIDIIATAPFTGSVEVLAVPAGANPFLNILPSRLTILRTLVRRWKPAKARCAWLGFYAAPGNVWGWPLTRKWGDVGLKWGAPNDAFALRLEGP